MRKILISVIAICAAAFLCVFFAFRHTAAAPTPDAVWVNDTVMTAIGAEADLVPTLVTTVESMWAQMQAQQATRDRHIELALYLAIGGLGIVSLALLRWYDRIFFSPFRRLEGFARAIAAGNLDLPLTMDRGNRFGAFTEAFDLMRDQLGLARESEQRSAQSKRELVASLSHDLKTPVASIQAVSELMLARIATVPDGEQDRQLLGTIYAKAGQINTLVTNLFHSTLEELEELAVTPVQMTSAAVTSIIDNADYADRLLRYLLPDCQLLADPLRLQQVVDNIISNAYKYAGTDISIKASLAHSMLVIDIADQGPGVPAQEVALVTAKFYRSRLVDATEGYGLGLYIASSLMDRMAGTLTCMNTDTGFLVRLELPLASAFHSGAQARL